LGDANQWMVQWSCGWMGGCNADLAKRHAKVHVIQSIDVGSKKLAEDRSENGIKHAATQPTNQSIVVCTTSNTAQAAQNE
jgi:hypothetical protein